MWLKFSILAKSCLSQIRRISESGPSVKCKIRNRFSCVVIMARSLCLIFRRNATRAKSIRHASAAHSSESARGYLPRFYLPRGADRQKRQIAPCRFTEYAFRFSIATRLSVCESMNREQIYPRILQKSAMLRRGFTNSGRLYYIVLSFSL